jgi:hypothetical protein
MRPPSGINPATPAASRAGATAIRQRAASMDSPLCSVRAPSGVTAPALFTRAATGRPPALPQPHLDGVTNQPDGTVRDATDWNPSWTFTAGGMISTLDDMHTWTVALATGDGLISEEMQRLREGSTTSTVPPNDAESTYALGFFVDRWWCSSTPTSPHPNSRPSRRTCSPRTSSLCCPAKTATGP